jgi:hypothetical protein
MGVVLGVVGVLEKIMLSPEDLAKNDSEEAHQTAFFCALVPLRVKHPELLWMHAIPNGGARDSITAGVLKKTGVRAGVWDCFLPVPNSLWHGLYIEFKRPARRKEKHGGLSEAQLAFGMFVHKQGYATAVVYTWQEAIGATIQYLRKD